MHARARVHTRTHRVNPMSFVDWIIRDCEASYLGVQDTFKIGAGVFSLVMG